MDDLQRQLRIALFTIMAIIPIGVVGFRVIEGYSWLDATYLTVITLATIGYGDLSPTSTAGKLFDMFLVVIGLGAFAFFAQAIIGVIASPALRNAQLRRRVEAKISKLENHYIICGMGELVDKTVEYLLEGAEARRQRIRERQLSPIDDILKRVFGDAETGRLRWLRRGLRIIAVLLTDVFRQQSTILDVVVIVTKDADYAKHLRDNGLLVIEGDPTDDDALLLAGIKHAQALMVLLNSDTETLLSVLAAHNVAPHLPVTASVIEDELSRKMIQVGAQSVITPYGIAGQFLNSATLRPAVSAFFNGLLFEHETDFRITQLELYDDSPWIGRSIASLKLRKTYNASVVGLRYDDARFGYAPDEHYILQEDETVFVISPAEHLEAIQNSCREGVSQYARVILEQPLPFQQEPITSDKKYSLIEAEEAIGDLSKHFIICGNDRVARSSIATLDPTRPFVVISDDNTLTSELLKRGFRVVHGNPTSEEVLMKAGVERAQAIMVALEDKAASVLTILNSRSLNRRILITATANSDDMIEKLERAGADRVVSPFHTAARFTLLTTTRPKLAAFLNYGLFNYITGLETTEIYMEDDSIWISKSIEDIGLKRRFNASVIGVRQADRETFIYAPPHDYIINKQEVLIIVTPMEHSDELRDSAHGGTLRRPSTLRNRVLQSTKWTPDQIQRLLQQARSEN